MGEGTPDISQRIVQASLSHEGEGQGEGKLLSASVQIGTIPWGLRCGEINAPDFVPAETSG